MGFVVNIHAIDGMNLKVGRMNGVDEIERRVEYVIGAGGQWDQKSHVAQIGGSFYTKDGRYGSRNNMGPNVIVCLQISFQEST
jgi:hypothetical protein